MRAALLVSLFALAFACTGCSLVSAGLAEPKFLTALNDEDPDAASRVIDRALGTAPGELPLKTHSFTGLLLAERGTIRMAASDPLGSTNDLRAADKILDVGDMSLEDMMRHLAIPRGQRHAFHMGWFGALNFPYVPRLHERLMVNPLEMISDLDLGDDEDARVESRRLDVMIDFANRIAPKSPAFKTRALSGILAGFAFEQSEELPEACRQYRDATASTDADLSSVVPGGKFPNVCAFGVSSKKTSHADAGEILIVFAYGLVPHSDTVDPPNPMAPNDTRPRPILLVDGDDAQEKPTVLIDGESIDSVEVLALSDVVRADFDQATKETAGVSAPLSWSTLPARFAMARVKVSAGHHDVELGVRHVTKHEDVLVRPASYAAISLVVLR